MTFLYVICGETEIFGVGEGVKETVGISVDEGEGVYVGVIVFSGVGVPVIVGVIVGLIVLFSVELTWGTEEFFLRSKYPPAINNKITIEAKIIDAFFFIFNHLNIIYKLLTA